MISPADCESSIIVYDKSLLHYDDKTRGCHTHATKEFGEEVEEE